MIKVVSGSVETNSLNYSLGGGAAFAKGDLVRITLGGEIELATVKDFQAIALADSTDFSDGDKGVPVAVLNADTVLQVPCEAANAPDDYTIGENYGLVPTTKAQTLDLSDTTNEALQIVGKMGDDQWFDPDVDDAVTTGDGNSIYCKVVPAVLATRSAASA